MLFKMLGFGCGASLMLTVITGLINLASMLVSVFMVDRVGRRADACRAGGGGHLGVVAIQGRI